MKANRSDELPVGRVAGVFGLAGEVKCDPTSAGRSLFVAGAELRVETAGESEEIELAAVREHKGRLLVRLCGVESADAARRYAGATFFAHAKRLVLAPGEYLDRDLTGCALCAPDGAILGVVQSVEHYPSSDMLVVGGRLVPMVAEFIKEIDLSGRRIIAKLPPGLLDD